MDKFLAYIFKPSLNLFDVICYAIIMPLSIFISLWFLLLFIPAIVISGRMQIVKLGFRVVRE